MKKRDLLYVGCGQAGGNFIDELLSRDSRYNGLFINTSVRDVSRLKNADINKNVYLIPNADGAGGNVNVGIAYVRDHALSIIDVIRSFIQQTEVVIVSSAGGASGAAIAGAILRLAKKHMPDKKFHLVVIKGSLNESSTVLENSIKYWNSIMDVIDSFETIQILDNDKRKDKMDINKEWAYLTNASFDMVSNDVEGSIDEADLGVAANVKGYKVIYNLDSKNIVDEKIAVGQAINESIFFDAPSNKCTYLTVSLKKEDGYEAERIKEQFDVSRTVFLGSNKKDNLIMATGCEIPKMAIELIIEELEERKKNISEVVFDKNELKVDIERPGRRQATRVVKEVQEVEEVFTSNDEVIDLDDSFWTSYGE